MDKVVLFQPATRPWGMPNMSPFCSKLETYLRMAEVPHEVKEADFRKAPKGKIPFVSMDGALMGDSHHIIEAIERRLGDKALDAGMSPQERAQSHIMKRAFDEAFYFVGLYLRWIPNSAFSVLQPEFKKMLPGPLKLLVPLIRRGTRKKLHEQGTGRHSDAEINALGIADVQAFSDLLGDKAYLFGDKPRTADATAFAFIDAILGYPPESAVKQTMQRTANVVAYRQRVRDRWFKDLSAS